MILDVPAVAATIEEAVRAFTDIAVVGISGGVDSAVVASACVRALGAGRVHVVSMPYDEADARSFNARSAELARGLGARHHVVSIGEAARTLESALAAMFPGTELDRLTRANVRPRVRMSVLYGLCGELGARTSQRVRVMGTGHLSEDLIGYDTKGGDALCDIFILSDLVKSEVYQLARHYQVPPAIVEAVPSAGLYPGQTDEGELGYPYAALEAPTLALSGLLRRGASIDCIDTAHQAFEGIAPELARFVLERYRRHSHKHEAPAEVSLRCDSWFDPG